jgi:hypothetical protein
LIQVPISGSISQQINKIPKLIPPQHQEEGAPLIIVSVLMEDNTVGLLKLER